MKMMMMNTPFIILKILLKKMKKRIQRIRREKINHQEEVLLQKQRS